MYFGRMRFNPACSFFPLFLAFCVVPGFLSAQNADIRLLRKINLNRNTGLDPAFRFISNSVAPVSIALPVCLGGNGILNHDPVLIRQGIVAGAGILLANALSVSLKYAVHRKRPFAEYDDIQKAGRAGPYSFPSGHTTSSFAAATSLCLAFPRWYVIAPSCLWAGLVAYSRLHLGVHFPSDVLAGILIGAGSSLICYEGNLHLKK